MKIIIRTEGKSELTKEDVKVVFPFRQPPQLLSRELRIHSELLAGNSRVLRRKV